MNYANCVVSYRTYSYSMYHTDECSNRKTQVVSISVGIDVTCVMWPSDVN